MSDTSNSSQGNGQEGRAKAPVVPLGHKMPAPGRKLPVLSPAVREEPAAAGEPQEAGRTEIADGLSFVGHAVLTGVCTVKGRIQGNLKRADGARIAVVVTETGFVKGDIVADQISVMGRTEGVLDASGGTVALHESANVSGHVRYSRIQVNGSELNATLERVAGKAGAARPPQAPAERQVDAEPAAGNLPPVAEQGT